MTNIGLIGDAGPLKEGWRIQRDTPGYGPRRTAEELRKDLAAAKRYGDHTSRAPGGDGRAYCHVSANNRLSRRTPTA